MKKTVLRVREFEDRLTPAVAIDSRPRSLRLGPGQQPAVKTRPRSPTTSKGLVNGTVRFGLRVLEGRPGRHGPQRGSSIGPPTRPTTPPSLDLMRATPAAGPLAWDGRSEAAGHVHNDWMKANGFAHTQDPAPGPPSPGSQRNTAAPDTLGVRYPTYRTWSEDIAWAVASCGQPRRRTTPAG